MSVPFLIFDIETIPDLVTGRRLYPSLNDLPDAEALTALTAMREAEVGNSFMQLPLHKIACLSFLWVNLDSQDYRLKSLSLENLDEAQILSTFFRAFEKTPLPMLVTWNGSGFDLPVLMYRAMHHRLSAPRLFSNQSRQSYLNRYSDSHIDLMDKLSAYNGYNRQKLDTVAALCGFAGKQDIDGSMVVPLVEKGDWQTLTTYCESDVINTWLIFLRHQKLIGKLSTDTHDLIIDGTLAYLNTLTDETGEHRHAAFLNEPM